MKIIDIPRSGSAGSVTSSRNRAGQYTRNRRSPTQPIGSGRRADIRAAFSAATKGWSDLTDAQRMAWAAFADTYPYQDSLGQTIKLTGHQLYVACGTQLLNCGEPLPTDAPTSGVTPSVSAVTVSIAVGTSAFQVDATNDGTANDFLLIQVSPPMSAGRMFNGRWWQADSVDPTVGPYNVWAAYIAEFGTPAVGQKVFVKVTPVAENGLTGTPFITSALVAA